MNDRATKKCPFCGEEIKAEAIKCRYCREFLNTDPPQPPQKPSRPEPQEPIAASVPPTEKRNGTNSSAPPLPEQEPVAAEPDEEQKNALTRQPAEELISLPEQEVDRIPPTTVQSDSASYDDTPQPNSTFGKAVVDILLVLVAIIGIVLFIQQFNAIRSNEQIKAADPQAAAIQNTERAIKIQFLKKAEKGDAEAQHSLACGLLLLGKNEEAVKWLTLAAPKDTMAAWRLAWCHTNGVGTAKSPEKAFQVLKERVNAGKTDSDMGLFNRVVFALGSFYWDGIGCEKKETEAVRLFLRVFPPEKAEQNLSLPFDFARIESLKTRINISRFFKVEALDRLEKIIPPPIDINIVAAILGECYFRGYAELPRDRKMAAKYLKHSNIREAKTMLALCEKGDETSLFPRKTVTSDSSEEQYCLGLDYYKNKNFIEAVKWFRKAAEQGYAPAQHSLGVCYANGQGMVRDHAEAARWYRKAAEQGNVLAEDDLGLCYAKGNGVVKDSVEAVKWFRKAAEQGWPFAQYHLGQCCHNGYGIAKAPAEAVRWYRKAAEQGNANAQTALGSCYMVGDGVTKDSAEATKWLRKAAEQGFEPAIRILKRIGK